MIDIDNPLIPIGNTKWEFRHLAYDPDAESVGYLSQNGNLITLRSQVTTEMIRENPEYARMCIDNEFFVVRSLVLFAFLQQSGICLENGTCRLEDLFDVYGEYGYDIMIAIHKIIFLTIKDYSEQNVDLGPISKDDDDSMGCYPFK